MRRVKMIKINKKLSKTPKSLENGKSYKSKDVKEELDKLYNSKCCYCETANIKGAVEHFRPKSIYDWLTNDWENLLWSCHDCNNIKSAKLPVAKKIATKPDNISVCNKKEEIIMINPEMRNHFDVKFDKFGKISSENELMKNTIKICKLDRENLNDKRLAIYNELKNNISSVKRFGSKTEVFKHINSTFIKPTKKDKNLGFIAFRKYIIKNWLLETF